MAKEFYQPLGGNDMPRFAGPATMMRLPAKESAEGLDACFVGVPFDIGTSNRAGARHGPHQIRAESCMLRPMGGDHTITLPILRALAKKHGPLGMVHIDAHADVNDIMFGETVTHGTPFRRAVEENLIHGPSVAQIVLRATGYTAEDFDWPRDQGFRVVQAEECWYKSLAPLMDEIRDQIGDRPMYLSFDVDGLDPPFAPGTGSPKIGGLTLIQALEIIRGCRGLDVVGCDLVEVSPPYDPFGNTALVTANLLFEMLCVLPGVEYRS
jgi:guanidinobutyrase